MTAAPLLTGITKDQARALDVAHGLARAGVPLFVGRPDPARPGEFRLPHRWQWTTPDPGVVDTWRPGDALCALMGVMLDLADIDPRHGGDASWAAMASAGVQPTVWAESATPSGGRHLFVARLRTGSRDRIRPGVDIKGGRDGLIESAGRGLAYIAPTVRFSKVTGEASAYRWVTEPLFLGDDLLPDAGMMADLEADETGAELAEIVRAELGSNVVYLRQRGGAPAAPDPLRTFDTAQAVEYVQAQLGRLAAAQEGTRNRTLFESALLIGHFVPAFLDEAEAVDLLRRAVACCGLDDDPRQVAKTIRSGMERGMSEPYLRVPDAPVLPAASAMQGPPSVDAILDPTVPAADGATVAGEAGGDPGPAPSIAATVGVSVPQQPSTDPLTILIDQETTRELIRRRARARVDEIEAETDGSHFDSVYLNRAQIRDLPKPEPLIEGVLDRHTTAFLIGRDASFKSFVAVDWALSIATGTPWRGRAVQQGRVLYIAGEGAYGLADRIDAWEMASGIAVDDEQFVVRAQALSFFRGGPAYHDLLRRVRDGGFRFVVVDTLRRASGGAKENDSDMGTVLDRLIELKEATAGGAVLTVAHTGKTDIDTRGYSGIEDDSDCVWHCKREEDTPELTLKNTKAKDRAQAAPIELRAKPVEIGVRPDGKPLTSLVLVDRIGGQKVTMADSTARRLVLEEIRRCDSTGASVKYLVEALHLAQATVYRHVNDLARGPEAAVYKRGQVYYPKQPATVPAESVEVS